MSKINLGLLSASFVVLIHKFFFKKMPLSDRRYSLTFYFSSRLSIQIYLNIDRIDEQIWSE